MPTEPPNPRARRSCGRRADSCSPSTCSDRRSGVLKEGISTMAEHHESIDRPVPDILPILPLRAAVVFPHAVSPLAAGRASSVRLIEEATTQGRLIAVVMQRDPAEEEPGATGLHSVGALAMIHRVLKQPDGTLRLIVQGVGRLRVVEVVGTTPYLRARVELLSDVDLADQDVEGEALVRSATSLFQKVIALS